MTRFPALAYTAGACLPVYGRAEHGANRMLLQRTSISALAAYNCSAIWRARHRDTETRVVPVSRTH